MLNVFSVMLLSYLAGSFPTSIIVGKITKGIDIRQFGSGNAGGTNAFRVLGWKAGILVSLVDIGKGTFATVIISRIQLGVPLFENTVGMMILAGVCAMLGHSFTIFGGFRGGKGVATGAGMLIGLFPYAFFTCLLIFAIVLFSTGIVSLSSLTAAICLPIVLLIFDRGFGMEVDPILTIVSVLIPLFIIYTHRTNIGRLLRGEENTFEKIKLFRRKKTKAVGS